MRRYVSLSVFLVVVILRALGARVDAQNAKAAQLGCGDPQGRGCPDLIVDRQFLLAGLFIQEMESSDTASPDSTRLTECAVIEGCVTGDGVRRLLRFNSLTANLGPGDLVVGDPDDHPDLFAESSCHGHKHFNEYADYRLWTPAGYQNWLSLRPSIDSITNLDRYRTTLHDTLAGLQASGDLVVGRKQGFCVIDYLPFPIPGVLTGSPPKYFGCGSGGNQGISVGYADLYQTVLDCQWIDITDIPPGDYILEDEVNPERLFKEANYANNAAAIPVKIPDRPGHTQ